MEKMYFIILYLVFSPMKALFANDTDQAVLIIDGIKNIQINYLPKIKIIKYGLTDNRINEVIEPQLKNNTAIYRFHNLRKNEVIQFENSDMGLSIPFFLLSAKDSVNILIHDEKLVFSGLGYEKFECLYKLQHIKAQWQKPPNSNIDNSFDKNDRLLKSQESFLKEYKSSLKQDIYEWVLNETRLLNQLTNYVLLRLKKEQDADYQSTLNFVMAKDKSIDHSTLSHYYPSYIFEKYRFHLQKINKQKFDFNEAFKYFNHNYTGLVKEQLLSYLISKQLKSSIVLPEQLSILNAMKCPTLKEYIKIFTDGRIAGIIAPSFSLTGIDGKRYSLEDFAGKVIILDFWFTGCGACKLIPPILGPLASKFKDQNDVIFLSISIDKTIEQWKNSIETRGYTFDHSIKLYTGGLGKSNNIIENYNVKGYPTIIAISKSGKILSIPNNPRSDNGKSLEQLIVNEVNKSSTLN